MSRFLRLLKSRNEYDGSNTKIRSTHNKDESLKDILNSSYIKDYNEELSVKRYYSENNETEEEITDDNNNDQNSWDYHVEENEKLEEEYSDNEELEELIISDELESNNIPATQSLPEVDSDYDITPESEVFNRIDIKLSQTKGRCLYTRKNLSPGNIIMVENPLYISLPSKQSNIYEKLVKLNEIQEFSLPVRLHHAAICSFISVDTNITSRILDKWVPDVRQEPSGDVLRIIKKLKLDIRTFLYERALGVWRYNSFGHHSDNDGLVLYDHISMMSHSCNPTACWHYGDDEAFVLRSRVNLSAGDEISISYIADDDILKATHLRRESLTAWLFTCQCNRCSHKIDRCRGFRCYSCGLGIIFIKTNSDSRIQSTACNTCFNVPSQSRIYEYLEFEVTYEKRIEENNEENHDEIRTIYEEALKIFQNHWIIYKLVS